MAQRSTSRALIWVSCALAVLLAVLAILQYRWATRAADAEAQQTKAHLESAASLLAREFDLELARTYRWLQNEAAEAVDAHTAPANQPRLVRSVYYHDRSGARLRKLQPDGSLVEADPADPDVQILARRFEQPLAQACATDVAADILAVVAPLPERMTVLPDKARLQFRALNRCLVARLDESYLRAEMLPKMIARYFGAAAPAQFDFAVVSRTSPSHAVYGSPPQAIDVKQAVFVLKAEDVVDRGPAGGSGRVLVRQRTSAFYMRAGFPDTAHWELDVARKGGPISSAVVVWRRQNVLLSASVELLLLAAIGFLLVSTRRIERLAEQKMQFVAGVSHELRTPVSAIAMLSRNQADGLVTGAEQVRQYGDLIHQESQRLGEMVEQTLQYAGIQSGRRKPELREISLRQVIEDVLAARRDELQRAGFELQVDIAADLPAVRGDPRWLEKALDNLVSNAEKYTRSERWIRVSARYSEPSREVLVTVEDHGIGIDPSDFGQIFEPFCRGRRAVEAQIPGTGIGLSLVRSTVEAHRGSVTFSSEPDRGSSFTLHLPAPVAQ